MRVTLARAVELKLETVPVILTQKSPLALRHIVFPLYTVALSFESQWWLEAPLTVVLPPRTAIEPVFTLATLAPLAESSVTVPVPFAQT